MTAEDTKTTVDDVTSEAAATAEDASTPKETKTADDSRLRSIIESLIFVSDAPLPTAKIRAVLEGISQKDLKRVIDDLKESYLREDRGIYLEEVASGLQFRTKSDNSEWVARLVEQKPQRLSKAALEVLAIVAYNQPITKPEIENIRGVDSGSALNLLLERRLVRILGRKDVPGRPLLYGTTQEFLEIFNLKDLSSLPTLKEIESLADDDLDGFRPEGDPAPDGQASLPGFDKPSASAEGDASDASAPDDEGVEDVVEEYEEIEEIADEDDEEEPS
jgi:segregation and condensation protein B